MFNMIIEKQMNLNDRTLILGTPDYKTIPETVMIEKTAHKVIGISAGAKPPYMSLEIEKTEENLIGKIARS